MNLSYAVAAAEGEAMSLADKGLISAKTVLTGFVVVFVVLILLILIINAYSAIVQKVQNAGKKKPVPEVEASVSEPAASSAVGAAAADDFADGIPGETVTVISAAVAAYGSANGQGVRIKSIKKSAERGRSAWANAGVLDNTRPF